MKLPDKIGLIDLKNIKVLSIITAGIIFLIVLVLFLYFNSSSRKLSDIKSKGKLVALIRYAPTIYYEGHDGKMGFEYELLSAFAKYLGVELELIIVGSISEMLNNVNVYDCDLASGAITKTEGREKIFNFGPPYYSVQQLVVYKKGCAVIPEKLEDLHNSRFEIVGESSYEERLMELKETYLNLQWKSSIDLSTDQLIQKVWEGEIDYTIADQNIFSINRRYYPGIEVGFPISEEQSLAWVINKNKKALIPIIKKWLDIFENSGELASLKEKYYSHVEIYDYVDLSKFHRRIKTRLPTYEQYFKESAGNYDLSWTLLAAQSYQESHWRRNAKSPTGVRGIMMLTLRTAKAMGVTSRLDPKQSIFGGAKYLDRIFQMIPDNVREEDRLPFALASYNVGIGHMMDVQILAEQLGYDPSLWKDLKEVLPLLTHKKYYKNLKHGYARGTEPVRYVSRILNYRDILEKTLDN